jgi:general L-amino acid transport system substrate-binding protein
MVNAEELGVTSKNVSSMKNSKNPAVGRLLSGQGEKLGVSDDWAYNIIKQVGNYGESFERNVGMGSPLKISRGLNALWSKGGLQYAPPIR